MSARVETRRRWLLPPFTLFVFLVHPIVALLHPARLLEDPGTGWHLATGRYILATGTVPHVEVFSFTAAGEPWMQPYWLFETAAAALERMGGLPLYIVVCVLLYACLPVLLYRRMARMGVGVLAALLATALAYIVLLSHAVARPHVVTYLCFAFALERLDDVESGRRPAHAICVLPPLAALWCNLHGGFLAGLALVGVFAAVTAARAVLERDSALARRAAIFSLLGVAMLAATLLNPSGFVLHEQLVRFLAMHTTGAFNEFQSPAFDAHSWSILAFELLILATVAILARRRARVAFVDVALLLFFLHMALHAVRHMNLFAIVAAPLIGRALDESFAARWPRSAARWRAVAREQAAWRSGWLYFPAAWVVIVATVLAGHPPLPTSLDDLQLSRGAAAFISAHRDRLTRPFNTDNLGGSLIYRFWPELHVFVDDRIYVYGDAFVDDYLGVLYARPGWSATLERWDVDSAIVSSETPGATVLRASPEWQLAFEDAQVAIFFRRPRA